MVEFSVPFPSSLLNAVLIITLEVTVMIFGHHIYQEYTNASFRKQLLARKSVPVYAGRTTIFVLFNTLLLTTCIAIQLGFEGRSFEKEVLPLHPIRSALFSSGQDWSVKEKWDKHPSKMTISTFQPSPQRMSCSELGNYSYTPVLYKGYIHFGLYGREGCYYSHVKRIPKLRLREQFTLVRIRPETSFRTFQILSPRESQFSREDGVLSFPGEDGDSERLEQLSVSFNASFRYRDSDPPRYISQVVTFCVIKNWNYTEKGGAGMDTIAMITPNDQFSSSFQILPFTDIFQATVAENSSSLIPVREEFTLGMFDMVTSSLRPGRSSPREVSFQAVEDAHDVAKKKIYYAVSRLHFGMKDTPVHAFDFSLNLLSILDTRGGDIEYGAPPVEVQASNKFDTRVNLFALVGLAGAVLGLLVLKGYSMYMRRKEPFSIYMFDIAYIAKLRIPRRKRRASCESGYGVRLVMERESGPVLKLEELE